MMRRAQVRVEGGDAAKLGRVLSPEGGRDIPRVRVSMDDVSGPLVLGFEARDTPALRAALNSYLRWMALAQGIMDEVKA